MSDSEVKPMVPKITVEKDYNGYFEGLVRRLVGEKEKAGAPFKHTEIKISAGPWRQYGVAYECNGNIVHMYFYAALRCGFGSLSTEELEGLKGIL